VPESLTRNQRASTIDHRISETTMTDSMRKGSGDAKSRRPTDAFEKSLDDDTEEDVTDDGNNQEEELPVELASLSDR